MKNHLIGLCVAFLLAAFGFALDLGVMATLLHF